MPSGHEQSSVSFDRASEYYDRTRALSSQAMAATVRTLVGELVGRDPILEIGIGTGRIALPLAEEDVPLVGLDLSRPMMAKLVEKAGGRLPFPLVQGDAVRLPFRDGAFEAALAVHVLHLIPEWKAAARELIRVVRPGGVLLIDQGSWNDKDNFWDGLQKRFAEAAGLPEVFPGTVSPEDLGAYLAGFGLEERRLPPIADVKRRAPSELIQSLEDGLFSFTWSLDAATRTAAAAETRAWAAAELGDLDEEHTLERTIQWRSYAGAPDRPPAEGRSRSQEPRL